MQKENNQLTSSRSVGMRDINALLQSAPISRIKTLRDDEGRRGFTLIELLVVVIIVAILAAIALPQYQLAINKVRYISMMETVNAAKRSQELYYLTHGSYATSFDDLKADLPGNCSGSPLHYNCGNFALYLESPFCVYALLNKEPRVTYVFYYNHAAHNNKGRKYCGTKHSSQPERARKLCRSVTGQDSTSSAFFF